MSAEDVAAWATMHESVLPRPAKAKQREERKGKLLEERASREFATTVERQAT